MLPLGLPGVQLHDRAVGLGMDRPTHPWGVRAVFVPAPFQLTIDVLAANKANKPVILEEFGVGGLRKLKRPLSSSPPDPFLENKTTIYPTWVQRALDTEHA